MPDGIPQDIIIINEQNEVQDRLKSMDLDYAQVRDVIEKGHIQQAHIDPSSAESGARALKWNQGVKMFRQSFVTPGGAWALEDPDNVPLMINESQKLCVAMFTGNKAVGQKDLNFVGPKRIKPWFRKLASLTSKRRKNRDKNPETETENATVRGLADFSDYSFWMLMTHVDGDVIYAELSEISLTLKSAKTVFRWPTRILLAPITLLSPTLEGESALQGAELSDNQD